MFTNANRRLWNEWTAIHEKSDMYNLESFIQANLDKSRPPRLSLHALELTELAEQVQCRSAEGRKTLLHLQCHFGMDSLSWALSGAKVTGVDFSDKAIDLARSINEKLSLDAEFICSDIYELPKVLEAQYDIVYTSYGVLTWLADIWRWGEIVARYLKPGGVFYIAEGHPFGHIFDDDPQVKRQEIRYPYFTLQQPMEFATQGSYADRDAHVEQPVDYEWIHSLGDIVTSLCRAGLTIQFLHEFNYSVYPSYPELMQEGEDGLWRFKEHQESIPLQFSIMATKK